MFFFLPIGVEGFRVRVPLLSIIIAGLCLVIFGVTWVGQRSTYQRAQKEAVDEIIRLMTEHPYLKVSDQFKRERLPIETQVRLENERQRWMSENKLPPDAVIQEEQAEADRAFAAALQAFNGDPMRKWAFVPANGLFQKGLVTHMFLHFGWMHLLGNLLFFALCAPMLEDAWGRSLFGLFYFFGGIMAAIAQFALDHHTYIAMGGASGAIAACMGAFAVRFATRRVMIAYLIFIGFRLLRGIWHWPAWVCGVLWFLGQVFDLVVGNATGVAVMAHIGGFVFGAGCALGMTAIGLDKDLIATSELDDAPLQQSFSREVVLAHGALRQGDLDAARVRFTNAIRENPEDDDAAIGLVQLDLEVGSKDAAMRRLDMVVARMLRSNLDGRVISIVDSIWAKVTVNDFRVPTASVVAKVLDEANDPTHLQMARVLYERAGTAPGFAGAKALIRVAELHLQERNYDDADRVVKRLESRKDLADLETLVRGLRGRIPQLTMPDEPPEEYRDQTQDTYGYVQFKAEAGIVATNAPKVTPCVVLGIGEEGLSLQVGKQQFHPLAWSQILGVGAGVVARSTDGSKRGGLLVVDLVVAWGNRGSGPQTYRFNSDSTVMSSFFPGDTAGEVYRAFFNQVIQRSNARPLPDTAALFGGSFARFDSVEQRDEALFSPDVLGL